MQLNSTEIAELIKQRIEKFEVVSEARNEGTIVRCVGRARPS